MKRSILFATVLMAAGSLFAADAKEEVTAAAKKLAAAANSSWTTTMTPPGGRAGGGGGGGNGGGGGGGGRGRGGFGGPMMAKTEKGGFTVITFGSGENAMQGVVKGEKGAMQTPDGWQSIAELTADNGGGGGGGFNRGAMTARRLQTTKAPDAAVTALLENVKTLTKADDAYTGDLNEAGAKALLSFGPPRGGGGGPEISGAKASVKIWVKDGVLAKYETHVTGTISFNGNDMERDTTATTEIKDVGTTKVEVPEDAKKKL